MSFTQTDCLIQSIEDDLSSLCIIDEICIQPLSIIRLKPLETLGDN